MRKQTQRFVTRTLRGELRAAENRAVAIRKLLARFRHQQKGTGRGEMNDVERLVDLIEQLARLGQGCSAEDAVEIATRIEALSSIVATEIDSFLTF